MLLRIEDIDTARCTPEFTRICMEDLRWLGLEWPEPVRMQSQHFADYAAAFFTLKDRGLLYPCFCSRGDIAKATTHYSNEERPRDPDNATLYPGTCKHLSEEDAHKHIASGKPHAWRLDMAKALAQASAPLTYMRFDENGVEETVSANPARWGDVVLKRKEIPTSYHIAVVVDDALQDITHIVRGQDLEAATDIHVLLQHLLGLPTPRYHHHALLKDESGQKLAKSRISQPLAELRAQGISADEVRRIIKP